MPIQLTCPRCQTRMMVSDAAPRVLTCPRCLAQIANPGGFDLATMTAPRPVIPLEQQASNDQRWSRAGLIAIIILLTLGGIGMVQGMDLGGLGASLTIALLTIAAAGLVVIGIKSGSATSSTTAVSNYVAQPPPIPGTLAYRSRQIEGDGRTGLRFAGGFFTSIGVCAACFILLAATVDLSGRGNALARGSHVIYLAIVLAAVVGLIVLATSLRRSPVWTGFGPGVTVGLVLGMMALGPCGFCYLMTLG